MTGLTAPRGTPARRARRAPRDGTEGRGPRPTPVEAAARGTGGSQAVTWRGHALAGATRWGLRPLLALPLGWALHRRAFALASVGLAGPEGVRITRGAWGGVPGREIVPEGGARGTILWLHGGAFVMGSSGGVHARLGAALARATGRRVILPDYRLAPEHPFPAAPDDTLAAARALAREGPFALGGDSAGATLALATLAGLVAEGLAPERVALTSPAVDLDKDRLVPDAPGELLLPVAMLRRVLRDYAGGADPLDPRLSPIHARYEGAPPVLILAARGEILEGDTDAIASRLAAQGVTVTTRKETGVPHGWPVVPGLPAAERSLAEIAAFLAPEARR